MNYFKLLNKLKFSQIYTTIDRNQKSISLYALINIIKIIYPNSFKCWLMLENIN